MSSSSLTSGDDRPIPQGESTSSSSSSSSSSSGNRKPRKPSPLPDLGDSALDRLVARFRGGSGRRDDGDDASVTNTNEFFGWAGYDLANSLYASFALPLFLLLIQEMAAEDADENGEVEFGGSRLSPSRVALLFLSLSVMVQCVVFPFLGAHADHGHVRNRMLVVLTALGAAATCMVMAFDETYHWRNVGGCLIVSNAAYGAALVVYNSFLPILVDNEASVAAIGDDEERIVAADEMTTRVSSYAFAFGYVGVILLQVVSFLILTSDLGETFFGTRIVIFLSGLLWLVLSAPTFMTVRERDGLQRNEMSWFGSLFFGWRQTWSWIRRHDEIPGTFPFLLAFFLYSDAYTTLGSILTLVAREQANADPLELTLFAIVRVVFAMIGNIFFLHLIERRRVPDTAVVLVNLGTLTVVSLWGAIAMRSPTEFYIANAIFGLSIGSVQSTSRSILASMIPRRETGVFFAIYSLTDRGSSLIGPLVVASSDVQSGVGAFLYSFFFLIIGGLALLWASRYRQKREPPTQSELDDVFRASNPPMAFAAFAFHRDTDPAEANFVKREWLRTGRA